MSSQTPATSRLNGNAPHPIRCRCGAVIEHPRPNQVGCGSQKCRNIRSRAKRRAAIICRAIENLNADLKERGLHPFGCGCEECE